MPCHAERELCAPLMPTFKLKIKMYTCWMASLCASVSVTLRAARLQLGAESIEVALACWACGAIGQTILKLLRHPRRVKKPELTVPTDPEIIAFP